MSSPSAQPQPSPGKKPVPGSSPKPARGLKYLTPPGTGRREVVMTLQTISASLNFSDAVNVVINVGSVDPTANNVSVSWNGTVVFTTTDPSDPGLQTIRTGYSNGTTDNSLSVTLGYPAAQPPAISQPSVTYSASNISANRSTTPTVVSLRA